MGDQDSGSFNIADLPQILVSFPVLAFLRVLDDFLVLLKHIGRPIFIQCRYCEELRSLSLSLSMRFPDRSPVLDKNRAPMGPEILSSAGAGAWTKAPMAFPDSSSVLDRFQSATHVFAVILDQSCARFPS